jgi:DNA-binding MarR family transcriptional regulator
MLDLLAEAHRRATTAVDNEVAPRHPTLRTAHLHLFRTQDLDGTRLTELAAAAGTTKQSMHELVTHLEQEGYLTRERDPEDNRRRRITLTERGHTLRGDMATAQHRLQETWRTRLGDEAYDALSRSLALVANRES